MLDIEPIRILDRYAAKGVIHVGANDGEEFVYYKQRGIQYLMGFEPLTKPYEKMKAAHPEVHAYNIGLSDESALVKIHVTENDKASSTLDIIKVDDYEHHPVFKDWNMGQLPVVDEDTIILQPFNIFVESEGIDVSRYDVLVIDVQGMEYETLEGFGKYLKGFTILVIECSEVPVYVGEKPASAIIRFLKSKGFYQATPTKLHNDILFMKEGTNV